MCYYNAAKSEQMCAWDRVFEANCAPGRSVARINGTA
jgi:hypothetical protein